MLLFLLLLLLLFVKLLFGELCGLFSVSNIGYIVYEPSKHIEGIV
jgi:hypothetical protein